MKKITKPLKKISISVRETLLSLPVGTTDAIIKTKDISSGSIRSAVSALNKKGYSFKCTERGLVNEVRVSRFK